MENAAPADGPVTADGTATVAGSVSSGARRRRPFADLSRIQLLSAALWLLAAALAVTASFARTFHVDAGFPAGAAAPRTFGYAYDGWGRVSIDARAGEAFGVSGHGPRYGVLFCFCAALMLLACLVRAGRALGLAGALILAGVVSSLLVSDWPLRGEEGTSFRFGASPWLAATASLIGLAAWFVDHDRRPPGTAELS